MMELYKMTALELGAALKQGEISPAEVLRAAQERISACQGDNNAFITVHSPLPAPLGDGPLAGVPMALKDNICTKSIKTTCASKILGDFTPPYDATVVEKLPAAGGVSRATLNRAVSAWGSTS